jgi:uncharacterized protein YacL
MVLNTLRAFFILLMAAVGWAFINDATRIFGHYTWLALLVTLLLAIFFVAIDIFSPRKKLAVFSGTFLGLIVGVFIAYAMSFVVALLVDYTVTLINASDPTRPAIITAIQAERIALFINLTVGMICCYLAISFVLQTKDDFRFIIPYVEFTKQTKGSRPVLLDTSVLIDGRITDIASTGILEAQLVVPRFVLHELQTIADSADKLKRARGRRGLDILQKLRENSRTEVIQYETAGPEIPDASVDERLLELAKQLNSRILTTDFNLNKVAQLRGVDVININDLANAMKPVVLPGERMNVRLLKPGEQPDQGIGYLEDGTMVVVEQGRQYLNEEVEFTVTSALQTSAGRMIFGRMSDGTNGGPRRHRARGDGH